MSEEQLEMLITQTINAAVATIPSYLKEIEENKETLKVENPQEFVYGIVAIAPLIVCSINVSNGSSLMCIFLREFLINLCLRFLIKTF